MRLEITHDSNQHHLALEFFVHGIRYFIGCVLDRLFCITGELFCLALRLLSEALGLQLFRARNFTGGFLDFSRGLIGYARNLVLPIIHLLVWVYVTLTIQNESPRIRFQCPIVTARKRVLTRDKQQLLTIATLKKGVLIVGYWVSLSLEKFKSISCMGRGWDRLARNSCRLHLSRARRQSCATGR